jgi:hypothetical protein
VHATRTELHRISAHVLGRRRYQVSGHFGLRVGPVGIVTPAYGAEPEVLRIASGWLIREVGSESSTIEINGATLADLAAFAGADLATPFSAGADTPPLGDVDAPIALDGDAYTTVVRWLELGANVLDALRADLAYTAGRDEADGEVEHLVHQLATVQLWPEHFDLGTVVTLASGRKANLGFSTGDGYSEEPYAYVGPWDDARPGDREYWNAPFGASLSRHAAFEREYPQIDCVGFMLRGLAYLSNTQDSVTTTKGAT